MAKIENFIPADKKNRPDKRTLTVNADTHERLKVLSTRYNVPINQVIKALLDANDANA
jgi:hypothetical protein